VRLIYEHVLLPGIFIQEPAYLVFIHYKKKELGIFGFDVCGDRELGTAILCRACELIRASMVNKTLHDCVGVVKLNEENGEETVFTYDDNKFTFINNE
jgi:hypothetical protein